MMRSSDQLDLLAGALSAVQASLKALEPTHMNAHLRSRYADLAAVWAHVRPLMSGVGLSVAQGVSSDNGNALATTRILHSSGQWMEDTCMVPVSAQKGLNAAQCMGLALTYARRYGLAAMLGVTVSDEDPDGGGPETTRAPLDEDLRVQTLIAEASKYSGDADQLKAWWAPLKAEIEAMSDEAQDAIKDAARKARKQ